MNIYSFFVEGRLTYITSRVSYKSWIVILQTKRKQCMRLWLWVME